MKLSDYIDMLGEFSPHSVISLIVSIALVVYAILVVVMNLKLINYVPIFLMWVLSIVVGVQGFLAALLDLRFVAHSGVYVTWKVFSVAVLDLVMVLDYLALLSGLSLAVVIISMLIHIIRRRVL